MFEIKLNMELTAPDLSKAIEKLAEALAQPKATGITAAEYIPSPVEEKPAAPEPAPAPAEEPKKTTAKKTTKKAATKKAAPAPEPAPAPAPVPVPEPTPAPAPAPESVKYDLGMITRASASIVEKIGVDALFGVLKKYNVQAITMIPQDRYADFAQDLRALGADI